MGPAEQPPHFNLPVAHRDHAADHIAALVYTMAMMCGLIVAILLAVTIGASHG